MSRTLTKAELGVLLAVMAHLVWGGMAFYFGLIRHISPVEIAVNRGLWSLPIAAAVVWYLGQWGDVWRAVAKPRNVAILALTSGLVVFNWGFYVWSIEVGRTLESSLGYFINPLLNVVMGYLFLASDLPCRRNSRWIGRRRRAGADGGAGAFPLAGFDAGFHLLPLWLPAEDHPRGSHPGLPDRGGDHRAALGRRAVVAGLEGRGVLRRHTLSIPECWSAAACSPPSR